VSKFVGDKLKSDTVEKGVYYVFKGGRWLWEKSPFGQEEEPIKLVPFPFSNPKVYHFHPIAFVEQMRRFSNSWHDPVLNPQLNKYTFNANFNPANGAHGNVRKWRTKVPSHTGLDIFAIPGTEVYACMDGIVVDASTSYKKGNNKTVRIKINNTNDFLKHISHLSYSLQYERKGEIMGVTPTKNDTIYLIYMHEKAVEFQYNNEKEYTLTFTHRKTL